MLKFSREYEAQADALGAIIMAGAGYDPIDLANVFRTIEAQGGSGGPQFLSDHPNPGNRYQAITNEARYLTISQDPPIKMTRDFERIQNKFRSMPRARSMSEIQRGGPAGNGGSYPNGNSNSDGRYSDVIATPSSRFRSYNEGNVISVSVPDNWEEMGANTSVAFAPAGATGTEGITRGIMIGVTQGANDLSQDTRGYISSVLQDNNYLSQTGSISRTSVSGREAFTATLSGRSPVTGRNEIVTVYTTETRNGQLLYFTTVVPENESYSYSNTFRQILNSVRFTD
jgi:predicted Zn-dependent protease